jgi:hypothetical protein
VSQPREKLDVLLRAIADDRLHELTAEQMAELERLLAADPQFADRVAGLAARPGPALGAALSDRAALPTAAEWARTWERVDAGVPQVRMRGVLRLWQPFAAVAAALLLLLTWRLATPPAAAPWQLTLATDTQIDALEVSDGATSFVVSSGPSDARFEVIWVLEDQS